MKIEKYQTTVWTFKQHSTTRYKQARIILYIQITIHSDSSENQCSSSECSSSELFLLCPSSRLSLFLSHSVGSWEFPLSGVSSKGGSKTLSVSGKLEQLQLTTFTASNGVSRTLSKSGTTAATAIVFAVNISSTSKSQIKSICWVFSLANSSGIGSN